jgi:hypothetical protein
MSMQLPKPIAAYMAAENSDTPEALGACFAADAVVLDEGRTIEGLAAIKAWKVATKEKYRHSVEPLDATELGGETTVTTRVSGDFPGSPVTLRFVFRLAGDKIAPLEIR